jgi:hypothetical protein
MAEGVSLFTLCMFDCSAGRLRLIGRIVLEFAESARSPTPQIEFAGVGFGVRKATHMPQVPNPAPASVVTRPMTERIHLARILTPPRCLTRP